MRAAGRAPAGPRAAAPASARGAPAPRRSRSRGDPPSHKPRTATCKRQTSARLWEAQVDLGRGRVGPAGGDDLRVGVEVDPLRAVDVAVAEERALPAAEAVVGDG